MAKAKCFRDCFANGICLENPIFRLMLGLCPTLAVTVSLENGLAIGIAAAFVLLGSNVIISLLKRVIPAQVRIPCYILIIASFVTIVKLVLQAYLPLVYAKLGLFVDIMVVNCIILGRAEAFANKNSVWHTAADSLGMGLGFAMGTITIGALREILGTGKIFGVYAAGGSFEPVLVMILPPGAFLTIAVLVAFFNIFEARRLRCGKEAR